MNHFDYPRHFSALAAAVAAALLFKRWDLFSEPFLPTFAMNGALHAAALVLALRTPQTLVRKLLFISIAAILSSLTLYIGILGLQLFAALPANERLYTVLGICSASGAITYGSLTRLFWMKTFSSRSILAIAFGCVLATSLVFFARTYFEWIGSSSLAAAWWLAFSAGLWYFDTHRNALARN